jgi:uncharacterized protein YbjT (DUF2867 family)
MASFAKSHIWLFEQGRGQSDGVTSHPKTTAGIWAALLIRMRILVTGGSGVIGNAVIQELLRREQQVRLLSRHAERDAKRWRGVEPFEGDVSNRESLRGACDGVDAVLHVAGIANEEPPEKTFEAVNVRGTRNVIEEAEAAGVKRFVYVSSLGADKGESEYHQSKRDAEGIVQQSKLPWTIVRPGNVYGPGDEVVSLILRMMRALPVMPVIDGGDQPFQPVWHEDLAAALATVIEDDQLNGKTLEVSGEETTSTNDIIARLTEITGRDPMKLSVPDALAAAASKVASAAGVPMPVEENKLQMLKEENVIRGENALVSTLGLKPTSLDAGLRELADTLPEQMAEDGVGSLKHKRFIASMRGSKMRAASLMTAFRDNLTDIMPIDFAVEPGTSQHVEVGQTLTAALPMRGNIQVRVEAVEPTRLLLATIEGHPLAGSVQFSTADRADAVEFAIDIYTRAANFFDWFAMNTVGAPMQDANWRQVLQRVIDISGGTCEKGVESSSKTLDDDEAKVVEKSLRAVVQTRQRNESAEDAAQR